MNYYSNIRCRVTILLIIIFQILPVDQAKSQIVPPYTNSFDLLSDTIGWTHYAIEGTDYWERGVPNYGNFDEALSPPFAWVTNLDGPVSGNSDSALETPEFDFSNLGEDYVFSFRHERQFAFNLGSFVEYSLDDGNSWSLLLNEDENTFLWQSEENGFNSPVFSIYKRSSISLNFLMGEPSVKFRFRFSYFGNGSVSGWLIDDFQIREPNKNIIANQGDSIIGITKYFEEIDVVVSYTTIFDWNTDGIIQTDFYVSNDDSLSDDDIFLGSKTSNYIGSVSNWINTFPFPENLWSGTYYIIYELDKLNAVEESDETDNTGYAVMMVDSVYIPPFRDDFEEPNQKWNTLSQNSIWEKGAANYWHLEKARSGMNGWYVKEPEWGFEDHLTSPYFDLTGTDNPVLCFWYKQSSVSGWYPFKLSSTTWAYNEYPNFSNAPFISIPPEREYNWDCRCQDLSSHSEEYNMKIRFFGEADLSSSQIKQMFIDDFYIGEAKPDVALEGYKTNRFSSSEISIDTLKYYLFNSGLSYLDVTTTNFYWSEDSILNEDDLLLGSNTEPALEDTSYVESQFVYSKPTNEDGIFYIIYKADADELIEEMREYDNIGYFKIEQKNITQLPYFNDFEEEIEGWHHNASLGDDEWVWGEPSGPYIDAAISGSKAFITSDTGLVGFNSRMHLFTPLFDLTQLENPVIEFDLMTYFTGQNNPDLTGRSAGNLMYSVDGGASWMVLDTTNLSFKRWYNQIRYQSISGDENISYKQNSRVLYGKSQPTFLDQTSYQGRDYDEIFLNTLDIGFLQEYNQVQFMFVFANASAPMPGMMIDNFKIREAEKDLILHSEKNLLLSSSDQQIRQNIRLKNDNNYQSEATTIDFYLSSDTILGDTDPLIGNENIRSLRPYENCNLNVEFSAPENLGDYIYLLVDIDPGNIVEESNELNNLDFLKLNMDSASAFSYPILFDFEGDEIDGWAWYHDSLGYRHGHRFRHKKIVGGTTWLTEDGEFFLDGIDLIDYNQTYSEYPIFYLESPSFDFSIVSDIQMSFDFACVGIDLSTEPNQGGNMQYSIDGGNTWEVLTDEYDPTATNWYNLDNITSLWGEPGWTTYGWSNASYDLSFLEGNPAVRFRFKFRSEQVYSFNSYHGFRLDNFEVTGTPTTNLSVLHICQDDSVSIFGNFEFESGIFVDSLTSVQGLDSIIYQQLIVHDPVFLDVDNHACVGDSILLGGTYYFESTQFTDSLLSIYGCDSIVVTNLSFQEYADVSVEPFELDTICVNDAPLLLPSGSPPGGTYSGSGIINNEFYPDNAGEGLHTIYYTFTTEFGCLSSDSTTINVELCLSTTNYIQGLRLKVYPNPTLDEVFIQKEELNKDFLSIFVYDSNSKLILQDKLRNGEQDLTIDLSRVSSGNYFLHIYRGLDKYILKIIKQ